MKNIFRKEMLKTWFVVLLMFIVAAAGIYFMPDTIATHFGTDGQADAWGSKQQILMFPIVALLVALLAEPTKKLDPKRDSYKHFEKYYYNFMFGFSVLFLLTELVVIANGLGLYVNVGAVICFMVGGFMAFIGNMLPKIKQNSFFGIRTPWTMSDEQIWFKAHRFGGKVMVTAGLFFMAAAFIAGEVKAWAFVIVFTIMVGCLIGYPFLLFWRKTHRS